MYWFLNCLILFSIYLWATAKLPRWIALALSFTPLIILLFPYTPVMGYHIVAYLPMFMIGATLRPAITRYAAVCTDYRYALPVLGLFVVGHMWLIYHYTNGGQDIIVPYTGWLLDVVDITTIVQLIVRIGMLPAAVLLAVGPLKNPRHQGCVLLPGETHPGHLHRPCIRRVLVV
jgi:putative membrane protein